MHLVFLASGLVRDLCSLLRGDFFKIAELNNHAAHISTKEWEELGLNERVGRIGREHGSYWFASVVGKVPLKHCQIHQEL